MKEDHKISGLDNTELTQSVDQINDHQPEIGHYHCDICGESYPQKKQAEECFWSHGEMATLRWLALEAFCTKRFAERFEQVPEDLPPYWFKIEKMNELYQFAEDDGNVIWNKVLPGKRI